VESTYETKTAAAQLLLDAKSYADGIVSSASASLSASIGDVGASLSLFASYADGAYQSKATLSADVISILSNNFSIIGSGGTATIVDADIYANDIYSFHNYNSSYSNNGYRGYYGIYNHIKDGIMKIGFVTSEGTDYQYAQMGYDDMGNLFLASLLNSDINVEISSDKFLKLFSKSGLILDSSMYGTSTSGKTPTAGRLFFVKA
jgi:hypothetical protein